MTQYTFLLHTLLVLYINYRGIPVAFCISNCGDDVVMDIFIEFVLKKVGVNATKCLMSDMQTTYYNSWVKYMGQPAAFHVACVRASILAEKRFQQA